MKKLGQRKPRAKTGVRENCSVEGISVIIQAQSPHILEIARPVGHLSSPSLSIYCEQQGLAACPCIGVNNLLLDSSSSSENWQPRKSSVETEWLFYRSITDSGRKRGHSSKTIHGIHHKQKPSRVSQVGERGHQLSCHPGEREGQS